MGVLGEMFPGPRIRDEAAEAGAGERGRLGPIDLERGVVELLPPVEPAPAGDTDGVAAPADPA